MLKRGVQTEATIDKLLELGCHRGQGYLLSMPIAPEELVPIFEAGGIRLPVRGAARPGALQADARPA